MPIWRNSMEVTRESLSQATPSHWQYGSLMLLARGLHQTLRSQFNIQQSIWSSIAIPKQHNSRNSKGSKKSLSTQKVEEQYSRALTNKEDSTHATAVS